MLQVRRPAQQEDHLRPEPGDHLRPGPELALELGRLHALAEGKVLFQLVDFHLRHHLLALPLHPAISEQEDQPAQSEQEVVAPTAPRLSLCLPWRGLQWLSTTMTTTIVMMMQAQASMATGLMLQEGKTAGMSPHHDSDSGWKAEAQSPGAILVQAVVEPWLRQLDSLRPPRASLSLTMQSPRRSTCIRCSLHLSLP